MQTFLVSNFSKTAKILDKKRLFKQLIEARQILKTITGNSNAWINHPAIKSWKKHTNALKKYINCILSECLKRGIKTKIQKEIITGKIEYPAFCNCELFINSHKSALLAKDLQYYSKYFNNIKPAIKDEKNRFPYIWASKCNICNKCGERGN